MINARRPRTGDFKRGFLTTGLFRFSRHPNFFCEQAMWWTIYLFTVGVTGEYFHWSVVGAVLLSMLFQGSTEFTESLTLKKYPEYADYCSTTSRLVPFFAGPPLDEAAADATPKRAAPAAANGRGRSRTPARTTAPKSKSPARAKSKSPARAKSKSPVRKAPARPRASSNGDATSGALKSDRVAQRKGLSPMRTRSGRRPMPKTPIDL